MGGKKMTFPSEEQFNHWWKGKADRSVYPRSQTCPLAKFLRENGYPGASVTTSVWFLSEEDAVGNSLPYWALKLRIYFDRQLSPKEIKK